MPSYQFYQYPALKDWQAFERLCHDLWRRIWNDPNTQLNGRSGQSQNGVDIFGRLNGILSYQGVQCKGKDINFGEPVTEAELRGEVEKAKRFRPLLSHFILATTSPNDQAIQQVARLITVEHQQAGLFEVAILGWEDICQRLADYPDVIQKHWPLLFVQQHLPASNYQSRINNFLTEYLGNSQHEVPFGGRRTDLEEIDTWLIDKEAVPYRLLLAEAGRGKSALLTRWWNEHSPSQNDLTVIFIPVSLRFNTHSAEVFFTILLTQLAKLLNEPTPQIHSVSPQVMRGIASDYLARIGAENKRVLIIVDGLDEASDWQLDADLFPISPSNNLRVLLSSRTPPNDTSGSQLLDRLGWQNGLCHVTHLQLLTELAVKALLETTRLQGQLTNESLNSLTSKLYRLTEGDPLLLQLYVTSLEAQSLMADEQTWDMLQDTAPGLHGYFERWWRSQSNLWGSANPLRSQTVQRLINLLAHAKGPLLLDELQALLGPGISSYDVLDAIGYLTRFVIGDAFPNGYVFSHPRFGYYFWEEKLSAADRQATAQQFLEWGRRVIDQLEVKTLSPQKCLPYLVQFFSAHLEENTRSCHDILPLLTHEWQLACYQLEGGYTHYLNEVNRVWRRASSDNEQALASGNKAPHLHTEVLCALLHSSIRTIAYQIQACLLKPLVEEKIISLSQAIAHARQYPFAFQRAEALLGLVACETSPPRRFALLQEGLLAMKDFSDTDSKIRLICQIDVSIREEYTKAIVLHANIFERADIRLWFKAALLTYLPDVEREKVIEEVLALHKTQIEQNIWYKIIALAAPFLTDEQAMNQFAIIVTIYKDDVKIRCLAALAHNKSATLQTAVFDEIKRIWGTRTEIDIYGRLEILAEVASDSSSFIREECLSQATALAAQITDAAGKAKWLIQLWPLQSREEQFSTLTLIYATINGITTDVIHAQASCLTQLASVLPPDRDRDECVLRTLARVRQMPWEDDRSWYLTKLAALVTGEMRKSLLLEAFQTRGPILDGHTRAQLLHKLLPYVPSEAKDQCFQDAWQAICHVHVLSEKVKISRHQHASFYPEVRELLQLWIPETPTQFHSEALRMASLISDTACRADTLISFINYLPQTERAPLLHKIFTDLRAIVPSHSMGNTYYLDALTHAMPFFDSAQRLEFISYGEQIENGVDRVIFFSSLAKTEEGDAQLAMFRRAITEVTKIDYPNLHIQSLAQLLDILPQSLWVEAMPIAEAIPIQEAGRTALLVRLYERCYQEIDRVQLYDKLLDTIHFIYENNQEQLDALSALAPVIPESLVRKWMNTAIQSIRQGSRMDSKVKKMIQFANCLPGAALPQGDAQQREEWLMYIFWLIHDPSSLSSGLVPTQSRLLLMQVLKVAARQLDINHANSFWKDIIERANRLTPFTQYTFLHEELVELAKGMRYELLNRIKAYTQTIIEIGETDTAQKLLQVVGQANERWQ